MEVTRLLQAHLCASIDPMHVMYYMCREFRSVIWVLGGLYHSGTDMDVFADSLDVPLCISLVHACGSEQHFRFWTVITCVCAHTGRHHALSPP